MKIILLIICFLHLVITKHYLVKTGDEGHANKRKAVGEDYEEDGNDHSKENLSGPNKDEHRKKQMDGQRGSKIEDYGNGGSDYSKDDLSGADKGDPNPPPVTDSHDYRFNLPSARIRPGTAYCQAHSSPA